MFRRSRIYLDTAAGQSGNPSSPHEEGRAARAVLDEARERIARLLEVKSDDLVFTGSATEANALAIVGHVRAVRAAGKRAHVLYLPSAHGSVVENVLMVGEEGAVVEPLPLVAGQVDIMALKSMLRPETCLVALDAVCSETGTVWNVREVAEALAGTEARLLVDASQAPLTERLLRTRYAADLLTLDLAKVSSEHGMGLLVAPRTVPLLPLYRGGGQERGLRSGTEAPRLAACFADALAHAQAAHETFRAHAERDKATLIAALAAQVPEAAVYEPPKGVPNIVSLSIPGYDTDYLVALLDAAGIAVSTKSACETDRAEGSRAILALTGDAARARATLRVSWGSETGSRQLLRLAKTLRDVLPLARI